MNVFLSVSLALMMASCCGNAERDEDESTTEDYDYTPTVTPDYDYNATFDYFYVTEYDVAHYDLGVRSKASGIGPGSPLLLLGLAAHRIWN